MPVTDALKKGSAFKLPAIELILGDIPVIPNTTSGQPLGKRVQVLRVGTFYDERYGEFAITPAMLLAMVANFKNKVTKTDIMMDFAHNSDLEAAGWFEELQLSDDGQTLWGILTWTESGEKKVRGKEYRYVSADIASNYVDNESGKQFGPVLRGAGLTNRPVIKGMDPVIQLQESKPNETDKTKGASMDPKDQEIAQLKAELEKAKGGAAAPAAPAAKAADDSAVSMEEMKKKLADAQAKCAEYEAASVKAASDKALSEKEIEFNKLLSEKKAVPAQKKAFLEGNLGEFMKLAQKTNFSAKGHDADESEEEEEQTESDGTAQGEILALAAKKVAAKEAKDKGSAISMVLAENPELNKRYRKETGSIRGV